MCANQVWLSKVERVKIRYLPSETEACAFARSPQNTTGAPAELVSERNTLSDFGSGEAAAERREAHDLLVLGAQAGQERMSRAVVDAGIKADFIQEENACRMCAVQGISP